MSSQCDTPARPRARWRQVTEADIARVRDEVAEFEAHFGLSSEEMFAGEHPKVSELEETEDLHAWYSAWCRLDMFGAA